jgi:hypothetical protein
MKFPMLEAKLDQAPALYATEHDENKKIHVQITLVNGWVYDVFEAEKQGDDYLMFCFVHGDWDEYGYVALNDMSKFIYWWSEGKDKEKSIAH